MILNFTEKYQFSTRLSINNKPVEVIDSTRLLGTLITNDLKWEENTAHNVKKANARMQLLRRVASFDASVEDLKQIYFLFVISQLEQSAVVWHSSLSEDNKSDLERVQKSALKIILKALVDLEIESLENRRENLCLRFVIKCSKNEKNKNIFPLNKKQHGMTTRKH